ncbi:MAG: CPBP family intramembrane metalloprotease [Anaerolineales bacterium]|nr:CPBP family intramembrane metalloprotease [Anaerolineales bacterium]MCW5854712.1 CPBP family intramembrane metalloprotease [Anaerolineales bacterium]
MKLPKLENTADVGILIIVLMLLGLAVTWPLLGQWEAVRGFGAELLILAVTFYIARQYLPWEDAPRERIRRPGPELWIGLLGFVVFYIAWPFVAGGGGPVVFLAPGILAALTLAALRYGRAAWGLRWPTGRELIVLAVVAAVAVGLSRLFGGLLPPSEAQLLATHRPLIPGLMLDFSQIGANLLPALLIVFLTVIGYELYFRVFLQTRLAQVLPGRWALFAQAALYFAGAMLPLLIVSRGDPSVFPPASVLTQFAMLSNGVLAGYFWRKTGSLPLLVLLHLLAFVRWGL